MDIKELQSVHPGYAEYVYRWDYYIRSYMGAEEYRDGAYLRKYIGEEESPGGNAYQQRLLDTALHNHAKTVVDTYRSFIFRNPPTRTLGPLVDNEFATKFVMDCDLDGRTITAFMRDVNDMVSVYGGAWIMVDRPAYQVETAAQEAELDIRAYMSLYAPSAVMNWRYDRMPNGAKKLCYVKVIEEQHSDRDVIKIWEPEKICEYVVSKTEVYANNNLSLGNTNYAKDNVVQEYGKILDYAEYENPLGYVPFHHAADTPSFHRGIGTSDIGDVCDIQRGIYNKLSELYETIRLSSHPSIVAEPSAEINGGAGAIIWVDEQTQINPYLLQPTGASMSGIIDAIELDIEAIDAITHLKAVKAKSGSPMSGVALQTEKQLLNAKLADRAGMLERAEQWAWSQWFIWQGIEQPEEFEIHYEKNFDLRDKHSDIELYKKALDIVPHDAFVHYMHDSVAKLMIDDEEDLQEVLNSIAEDHEQMGVPVIGTDEESV